ncbi:MAG TPA: beta-ketoacyl synthase N-terminal-like domain-containing protein [Casimicrobiaceae bacterium]|nr:beta-ketoacyl synthase N-terminal-like domain-containing protein [Casimicrobiaceae bacterium]
MSERVVITGTGAVCASGMTPEAILAEVLAGTSAIRPIERFDVSTWPVQRAAEVREYNARALVDDRKLHKFIRRTDFFGIYAGDRAVAAADFAGHRATLEPADARAFSDATGVYVGSGGGAFENQYDYFPLMTEAHGDLHKFGEELGNVVNPMWLLRTLPNNVLCHVGIRNELRGSNACITNHSCGGTMAVIEAMEALRNGEAIRAVAIGHDTPIEPQNVLYYHHCGLLGHETIRPFDSRRDGSVFGEGAAALALETQAAAGARGAAAIGEVLGGGHAAEAVGLLNIREDGDGVERAVRAALADAHIEPADVGMIVAHGNGTRLSDASEAAGLRRVFGNGMPPVTAMKWAFGHLIAAAGILETVVALHALRAGAVPGIATLQALDPACEGLAVSASARTPRSDIALIVCRGFASTDAALVVRAL